MDETWICATFTIKHLDSFRRLCLSFGRRGWTSGAVPQTSRSGWARGRVALTPGLTSVCGASQTTPGDPWFWRFGHVFSADRYAQGGDTMFQVMRWARATMRVGVVMLCGMLLPAAAWAQSGIAGVA